MNVQLILERSDQTGKAINIVPWIGGFTTGCLGGSISMKPIKIRTFDLIFKNSTIFYRKEPEGFWSIWDLLLIPPHQVY